jgi:hypothetical protein
MADHPARFRGGGRAGLNRAGRTRMDEGGPSLERPGAVRGVRRHWPSW